MTTNHIALIYGVIRHLENNANGGTVFLDEINQSINDLYTVINQNDPDPSFSANASKADPMVFKFSDYYPVGGGNDFPRRVS